MKVLRAAALFALLATPAYAQMPNVNLIPELPSKTPDQIEAEQARDKAYKESLKKIPDAKVSADPWGNVRADAPKTDAPKAPAKQTSAKPRTRTGSNAQSSNNAQ